MNQWILVDERTVMLETPKGRFMLTKSSDPDYAGIFIDYQELGKQTYNLAVVEHLIDEDAVRTLVWQSSDADEDFSHEIDHERPESETLQHVIRELDLIQQAHPEAALMAKLRKDWVIELGYLDSNERFHPLQEVEKTDCYPDDLHYYMESKGWYFEQI